jgi:hypothetical protein
MRLLAIRPAPHMDEARFYVKDYFRILGLLARPNNARHPINGLGIKCLHRVLSIE